MKAEEMFKNLDFWSRKRNDTEIVWTRKVREDFIEKEIIFNLVVAKVAIKGGWLTKDEILEKGLWNLAVVKGRPERCDRIKCADCELSKDRSRGCHAKVMDWLKQPRKAPAIKLTKFEVDLLQSYLKSSLLSGYVFKSIVILKRMKGKGYFKDVDEDATIEDILANSEIKEEE